MSVISSHLISNISKLEIEKAKWWLPQCLDNPRISLIGIMKTSDLLQLIEKKVHSERNSEISIHDFPLVIVSGWNYSFHSPNFCCFCFDQWTRESMGSMRLYIQLCHHSAPVNSFRHKLRMKNSGTVCWMKQGEWKVIAPETQLPPDLPFACSTGTDCLRWSMDSIVRR